jgi:hypothetical protein
MTMAAPRRIVVMACADKDSHQQAGFTAGTIADDNELAANFGHGGCY